MGYILVGSFIRLKTLVYKINGAEYIKVYIKHNWELNPGVVPLSSPIAHIQGHKKVNPDKLHVLIKSSLWQSTAMGLANQTQGFGEQ